MNTFQVYILASDHIFYEGPCESLVVPTVQGQYGILAHHCNMVAAVQTGMLLYRVPGEPLHTASVGNGLLKVENNEVLVLLNCAERPEEIDANRARLDAERAREALLQKRGVQEYRAAQAQLLRATNRLNVKRRNQRDHYNM